MNDHGKYDESSYSRNSFEEDRFGVSWGKELIDDDGGEATQKPKNVKHYYSFRLNGHEYCQNETVYLRARDGLSYIGRIGKLYELVKEKRKQMHVRWFCRPRELPEGLPDVAYSESCKEVFVMWGEGAKNVNNPACTIRHCSVVCTAKEEWNTNSPSIEEIAAADHIFDRAYDLSTGTLRPLEVIVKKYGEHFVTGKGEPTGAPSKKRASKPSKLSVGGLTHREGQPRPLAVRASSDLTSLSVDSELWGLPALVTSPVPLLSVGGHRESSVPSASQRASKPSSHISKEGKSARPKPAAERTVLKLGNQGSRATLPKPARSAGTANLLKQRPSVGSSEASLRRLGKPVRSGEPADLQKKSSDASLPQQQAQKRLAAGRELSSPGAGEARDKSPRELTSAGPHGKALVHLNRERQKGTLTVSSKQKSLEVGKRQRANSPTRGTGEGKLKKPKLSAPSHIRGVGLTKEVTNSRDNVSPPVAAVPKSGELSSPRVVAGNVPENSSMRQQAQSSEAHQLTSHKLKKPTLSIPGLNRVLTNEASTFKDNASPSTVIDLKCGELRSPRVSAAKLPESSPELQQAQGPEARQLPTNKKLDVTLTKEFINAEHNISPSTAIDLRSLRMAVRNLPESSSGWPQAQRPEAVLSSTNQKQDGRVSSPPVGERLSFASMSEEHFSNLDQMPALPLLSTEVEKHNARSLATSSGHTAHSKQGHEQIAKDSRPSHENGANTKSMDLEQDAKLVSRSPADGLERLAMQHDVEKMSRAPSKGQKLTGSNYGKVPTAPQTTKKKTLANKEGQNVTVESQVKLAAKRSGSLADGPVRQISKKNLPASKQNQDLFGESQGKLAAKSAGSPADEVVPPSKNMMAGSKENLIVIGQSQLKIAEKRAGPPLGDPRQAGVGSLRKASKKRPSEKELSNPKSKATRTSDTQPFRKEVREEQQSRETGLVAKNLPKVSTTKRSDETRSGEKLRLTLPGSGEKVVETPTNLRKLLQPVPAAKVVGRAPAINTTVAPSDNRRKEMFEPRKKIFNVPWEESLRIALEQGKALHLQNLDPWFSSAEIEGMLENLLQVCCDVRMLPPKDFACYTSGQAIVLFRSQTAAIDALQKFTDNWLIWSKDERPVLASLADAKTTTFVSSGIHGFYTAELFASRGLVNPSEDQKNAMATSHCSQANTVEYEMGIQWRLLQERHTEAWTIAAQDLKAAVDHPVSKSK